MVLVYRPATQIWSIHFKALKDCCSLLPQNKIRTCFIFISHRHCKQIIKDLSVYLFLCEFLVIPCFGIQLSSNDATNFALPDCYCCMVFFEKRVLRDYYVIRAIVITTSKQKIVCGISYGFHKIINLLQRFLTWFFIAFLLITWITA